MCPAVCSARRLLLAASILLVSTLSAVYAAPFAGADYRLGQPDGSTVPVKVYGDEYYQHIETPSGQTLIRNAEGWICYAALNADSSDFLPFSVYRELPAGAGGAAFTTGPAHIELSGAGIRAKADPVRAALAGPAGHGGGAVPGFSMPKGSVKGITILLDFPDRPATVLQSDIEAYCNEQGYSGNGNAESVRDFFSMNSSGTLDYQNVVTAYYTAANNFAYYDDPAISYGTRAGELIREALNYFQSQGFDFSQLTTVNGTVPCNAFYTGSSISGWSKGLWPHQGGISGTWGGKSISKYQISDLGGSGLVLGTFVHENGHMLCGFPDLYPYSSGVTTAVGNFCSMGVGSVNNPKNPVPFNAYFRAGSGWLTLSDITDVTNTQKTLSSTDLSKVCIYRNANNSDEKFFIEAKTKSGINYNIPGEGLLIWHVDDAGSNTAAGSTFLVAIEQADGFNEIGVNGNNGDAGDFFRANNGSTSFSNTTNPAATWHSGLGSNLDIRNISAIGPTMTFDLGDISVISDPRLIVSGGTGSGTYAAGTVVPIAADSAATGKMFAVWTGDVSAIADSTAASTSITMPANGTLSIVATYKDLPPDGILMPAGRSNTVAIVGDTLFYDNSGTYLNYTNFFDGDITFTPASAGMNVSLDFLSFSIEDTSGGQVWDTLFIYDGLDSTASLIGTWWGEHSPGIITASSASGALTVRFKSDEATEGSGWKAAVSLVTATPLQRAAPALSAGFTCSNNVLRFTVPNATAGSHVEFSLYNAQGRCISSFVQTGVSAGLHTLALQSRGGNAVASGMYLISLKMDGWAGVQRVVLQGR